MSTDSTRRLLFIVPAPKVDDARAVLGDGSFTAELIHGAGQQVTHYATCIHPDAVAPNIKDALEAVPGMQSFPEGTNRAEAINNAGLRWIDGLSQT